MTIQYSGSGQFNVQFSMESGHMSNSGTNTMYIQVREKQTIQTGVSISEDQAVQVPTRKTIHLGQKDYKYKQVAFRVEMAAPNGHDKNKVIQVIREG